MKDFTQKPKGPWSYRLGVRFFTIILTILAYWLLGFLVKDIRDIEAPEYKQIEEKYLDRELVRKNKQIEEQLSDIKDKIEVEKRKQQVIEKSINNLQKTISQLLELQKLSLEKNKTFSKNEQDAFAESISHFLASQKHFQILNESVAALTENENNLKEEKKKIETKIDKQKEPARKEYEKVIRKHNNKLALYQLLVLVPLLIISVILVFKYRANIYFSIFLSFFIAALLKVSLVVHEYFPSKFFKYILILFSIGVVIRLLIYFIRSITRPQKNIMIKQTREAYERFLCPVCEFPIRRGPMKYLFWNRKSLKKLSIPADSDAEDSPYTCPACSSRLFEECPTCKKIRYSLLPFCEHCGTEKVIETT